MVLGTVSCTGSSNDETLDEERVQLKNKLLAQLDQLETRSEEGLEKREMSQCVQREYELYQCKVRELENTMRNSKSKGITVVYYTRRLVLQKLLFSPAVQERDGERDSETRWW